jgi:copper homeostasis protein
MFRSRNLEISVESVDAALAAERGGAHRIELCSNAQEGGTTPAPELLRAAREHVRLPIFTMIRPRPGKFLYSDTEFVAMLRDIDSAKKLQMDGIVLGLLNANGKIDIERTSRLVAHAMPLPVTFHRAFDECRDLSRSLEDVIKTGATRLLTSGGKRTAPEALEILADLVRLAGERITIMPGSGLHAGNIRKAARETHASEYHAGLSSVIPRPAENLSAFEQGVRKLANALRKRS